LCGRDPRSNHVCVRSHANRLTKRALEMARTDARYVGKSIERECGDGPPRTSAFNGRFVRASDESLRTRVLGEYREMPGLSLTAEEASRLWRVDASGCEQVLEELVRQGILHKRMNRVYIATT